MIQMDVAATLSHSSLPSVVSQPEAAQNSPQDEPASSHVSVTNESDSEQLSALTQLESLDVTELQLMSKEELIMKVQELQEMEEYHRKKLRELNESLAYLRQVVEMFTVSLETEAGVAVARVKPNIRVWRLQ